jgi:DNA topoisomerase-1
MTKYLIFLESYTKKKTIKTFLGNEYEIFATGGHLTELAKRGYLNLGVDLQKFVPQYDPLPEKSKNVKI